MNGLGSVCSGRRAGVTKSEDDLRISGCWEKVEISPSPRYRRRLLEGIAVYLASDASAFTTGAEIRIDGGFSVY